MVLVQYSVSEIKEMTKNRDSAMQNRPEDNEWGKKKKKTVLCYFYY